MSVRKCCWTCTARRVQCDGRLPTCQRCSRAARECQGYEMRLSWPRDNDKRRAMTGDLSSAVMHSAGTNPFFINTTSRDVELYNSFWPQMDLLPKAKPSPDLSMQPQLTDGHIDLIRYFYNSAYLSLVTFGVNPSQLRNILIRMAMPGDTVTKLAVFYALLALSSLRLNGLNQQAIQLKLLALHSLSTSAKKGPLNFAEASHHVAASMLLSACEVLIPSESSGEWLWYIRGALNIAETTGLRHQSHDSDTDHLLEWLYYHDLLSRFSVHNLRPNASTSVAPCINYPGPQGLQYSTLARHQPTTPAPNPTYVILNLLSETYKTLLYPWDHWRPDEEYRNRIKALEDRIGSLPIMPLSTNFGTDDAVAVQVYQMAARIYFVRASQSSANLSTQIELLIDNVFAGPLPGHPCGHFFPVFILACEARSDEQRTAILNLIDSTRRNTLLKGLEGLRDTIQSIWVQQDLHADSDLLVNYLGMISAVIGASNVYPSLVSR